MGHNATMGKHSGGTPVGPSSRALALNAGGAVLTAVAWALLVYYAIGFGPDAKAGELVSWLFLAVATLGAIACLFLALLLGARLLGLVRGDADAEPVAPGRRVRR